MRRADPLRDGPAGGDDAQFMLIEWSDPGGATGPDRPIAGLHVHHEDDEAWYVVEGALRFRLDDRELIAPAGSTVLIPAGVAHTFGNAGPEPSRYVIVMPSRLQQLIAKLHTVPAEEHAAVYREFASTLLE